MTADIKQNYFLFGNHQGEGNAVTVREADGITTCQLAAQGVQLKMRLERGSMQIGEHFGKAWPQVGMLLEKLARLTKELERRRRRTLS